MAKKNPTTNIKVVYTVHPLLALLIVIVCGVCVCVILYQQTLLNQFALAEQIQTMQRTPFYVHTTNAIPSPEKTLNTGY